MMASNRPPIPSKVRTCVQSFDEIRLRHPESESLVGSIIGDNFGRFKIWARNIGALQQSTLSTSLEYRLREAPRVITQVAELLEDLVETLEEVSSIDHSNQANQAGHTSASETGTTVSSNRSVLDDPALHNPAEPASGLEELLEFIDSTITNLFRVSVLIRHATTRDRYARAVNAQGDPFDPWFDICHVGQKFPLILEREWLQKRLGKAITQRRQFLRYCKQHRDQLAADTETSGGVDQDNDNDARSKPGGLFTQQIQGSGNVAKSILALTTASTLLPARLEETEQLSEDALSQTSHGSPTGDDDNPEGLRVPPAPEEASGGRHFECPYCCGIQSVKGRRSWKKHVFADLKPYVCTFEACDLKMFDTRSTWFNHELQFHHVDWSCPLCLHVPFPSRDALLSHIASGHAGMFSNEQMLAITENCKRPLNRISPGNCPFCDEWSKKLRAANPEILQSNITVTPSQFMKHVGHHMQQLALFALPRNDGEVMDSAGTAADLDRDENSGVIESASSSEDEEQGSQHSLKPVDLGNVAQQKYDRGGNNRNSDTASASSSEVENVPQHPLPSIDQGNDALDESAASFRARASDAELALSRELSRGVPSSCESANRTFQHDARSENPAPDVKAYISHSSIYEGYIFTKMEPEQPGHIETWAYVRRTIMPESQNDMRQEVARQYRKGITGMQQFEAPEMAGYKRRQIERLIKDRACRDDQKFEYRLVSVKLKTRQLRSGNYENIAMRVILGRQSRLLATSDPESDAMVTPAQPNEIVDLYDWEWHFIDDHGRKEGPFTGKDMYARYKNGNLRFKTLIRRPGGEGYHTLLDHLEGADELDEDFLLPVRTKIAKLFEKSRIRRYRKKIGEKIYIRPNLEERQIRSQLQAYARTLGRT